MKNTVTGSQMRLLQLGVLIILVNLVVMYFFDIQITKIVGLLSSVLLLGYFLSKGGFRKTILSAAIIMLTLRDVAILFSGVPLVKSFSLLCTIVVYAVIGLFAYRRLHEIRFSNTVIALGIFMIALNIFNVFYFSDGVLPTLYDNTQIILLFIQGALLIFMGFFAFLYNETFVGKQSLYLLYCVMAFVFSDLSGLATAVLDYEPALYADRAFYFVAFCLLIDYILNFEPEGDSFTELK
jgi:hypothetical protein